MRVTRGVVRVNGGVNMNTGLGGQGKCLLQKSIVELHAI